MSLRFEAWTLPWSGSFDRVVADIPVEIGGASGTVRFNDTAGEASIAVPAGYDRIDEIISDTVGTLIRVYDGSTIVQEFLAERVVRNVDDTSRVTISGPDLSSVFDRTVVYPYDYPASPTVFPDHIWSGTNYLANPGFEDSESVPKVVEVWVRAGGGTWTMTVDGQTTSGINHDASNTTVETAIEALSTVTDALVTGDGTRTNPWRVEFVNPAVPTTVTVSGASLTATAPFFSDNDADPRIVEAWTNATGGTWTMTVDGQTTSGIAYNASAATVETAVEALSTVTNVTVSGSGTEASPWRVTFVTPSAPTTVTVGGTLTGGSAAITLDTLEAGEALLPAGWTKSEFSDARADERFHGSYTSFALDTGDVRTGTYSLRIEASQFGGVQQIVQVTPGQEFQASGWVLTKASGRTFRLVIRDRYENLIGFSNIAPTISTWTQASTSVTIPDGVHEVIVRFAITSETNAATFWFDDMVFQEGAAAATVGTIVQALMDDAASDHSGDTRGTVLDWIDYTGFDGSTDTGGTSWTDTLSFTAYRGASYGQTFDALTELGYEWSLTPKATPSGGLTHDLNFYVKDGLGTDHTTAATPALNVGQGTVGGPIIKRIPAYTSVLLEGAEGVYVESKDATAETNFGRMERYVGNNRLASSDSLTLSATELLDLESTNRAAVQVTVQASDSHPRPLVDYKPGDTMYFQFPPALTRQSRRVRQISWQNTEPASYTVTGSRVFEGESGAYEALRRLLRKFTPLEKPSGGQTVPLAGAGSGSGAGTFVLVASSSADDRTKAAADFVCSGTNDELTIQAALDLLNSDLWGGTLVLSQGDFNIDLTNAPRAANGSVFDCAQANINVQGMGAEGGSYQTVLYLSGDGNLQSLFALGNGCFARDFTIYDNAQTGDTYAFSCEGTNLLENIAFFMGGCAAYFSGYGSKMVNCTALSLYSYTNDIYANLVEFGSNATRCSVINNIVLDCYGPVIKYTVTTSDYRSRIIGNVFTGFRRQAVLLPYNATSYTSIFGEIVGNVFEAGTNTNYANIEIHGAESVTIANNHIESTSSGAALIAYSQEASAQLNNEGVIITGNYLERVGVDALIDLEANSTANTYAGHVRISNNRADAADSYLVKLSPITSGGWRFVDIDDNEVWSGGIVYADGATRCNVRNNHAYAVNWNSPGPLSADAVIHLDDCTDFDVVGNVANLESTTAPDTFIELLGTCDDMRIMDNRITTREGWTAAGAVFGTGIKIGASCTSFLSVDRNELQHATTPITDSSGNARIAGHSNRGTATITNTNTSVSVTHDCGFTPTVVTVTPLADPGDNWWVSSIGATTFTINVGTAVGSDTDFAWRAEA